MNITFHLIVYPVHVQFKLTTYIIIIGTYIFLFSVKLTSKIIQGDQPNFNLWGKI